jgi:hypothetical protein
MCLELKEYENVILYLVIFKVVHVNLDDGTKNGLKMVINVIHIWLPNKMIYKLI